jgi:hypothetical protein
LWRTTSSTFDVTYPDRASAQEAVKRHCGSDYHEIVAVEELVATDLGLTRSAPDDGTEVAQRINQQSDVSVVDPSNSMTPKERISPLPVQMPWAAGGSVPRLQTEWPLTGMRDWRSILILIKERLS